ncbi:MAG: ribbon-helix-helix domain-containing protein [Patescibacteria group bacterium]|nr:ribbon-helix-helix domain-containing protein [Patescibacteria group bacterium]
MKKLHFSIPDHLLGKIDQVVEKWGFMSQAEFLRFLIVDFIRNDRMLLPADDTLKEHAKAIRQVAARRNAIKYEREWLKRGDTTL